MILQLWIGICLLTALCGALLLNHRYKMHELRHQEVVTGRWRKVGPDRYQCPQCGGDVTGWRGRKLHAESKASPCAELTRAQGRLTEEVKATVPGAGWDTAIVGEESDDVQDA